MAVSTGLGGGNKFDNLKSYQPAQKVTGPVGTTSCKFFQKLLFVYLLKKFNYKK